MSTSTPLHVVTGAFGYSGRYITRRLLAAGVRVRTLTSSKERPPQLAERVEVHPWSFDDPDRLAASLSGAEVLYNTYWVRFNYGSFKHSIAVDNTLKLFDAAKRAGVRRVVHTSITNPSEDSPLEYFSGKARLERALRESGLSCAMLRPTVLFGVEDIFINNIAWMLRRFPVFGIFGDGQYRLQPICVEDFADLAVQCGKEDKNVVIDAIGPETFTYRGMVEALGDAIGHRPPMVSIPPQLGYWLAWIMGKCVGDVVLTREEIKGLMSDLLVTSSPPAGPTKLTEWARKHRDTLGKKYASELARRR